MIRLSYECWKCPELHATDLGGAFWGTKYGIALVYLTVFGQSCPIMPRKLFYKWADVSGRIHATKVKR